MIALEAGSHLHLIPIFLSAFGVAFAAAISRLLFSAGLLQFTQPALIASRRFRYGSAWPIGALSALTLALGNAAYVYLTVATCQMLKTVCRQPA